MSQSPPPKTPSRLGNNTRWITVIIVVLSVAGCLVLFFDLWPLLRGGYGWRWPYIQPPVREWLKLLPFLITLGFYLLGLRFLSAFSSWIYLSWCILGTVMLSITALMWLGDPLNLLFTRTISGMTTGGFSVAVRIEDKLMDSLRNWPQLMASFESFSSHMAISPSGWPVSYVLLARALDLFPSLSRPLAHGLRSLQCHNIPLMQLTNGQIASAWLGIAAPFWASLTVLPLYDLGRRMRDQKLGRLAAGLWPLIPSLFMFLGTFSTPYPLATVTIFWLFWLGLDQLSRRSFAIALPLAGSLTGFLLLYSFAFLPFILFLGLFTLLFWQRWEERPYRANLRLPIISGLQYGLGLLFIFVIYTSITSHTPLAVFQSAMVYHNQLVRRYLPWLFLHTWDYALFLGLVLFILAIIGTFHFTEGKTRKLAIALNLTLLIVILSGTGRGETGRIFLFFAPFSLLIAIEVARRFSQVEQWLLLFTQAAWLIVILMILRTVDTDLTPPPDLASVDFQAADQPETAANLEFENQVKLLGYTGTFQDDPPGIILDLYWQAGRQLEIPYFFSVVAIGPNNTPVSDLTWQPYDYQFPTTCWHEAQEQGNIVDRILIPLPEPAADAEYWLSLRMFDITDDGLPEYVPVNTPGFGGDDQVGLGPFRE